VCLEEQNFEKKGSGKQEMRRKKEKKRKALVTIIEN
jgi:hypothetical protein